MFTGHYGVSFAAKPAARHVPLWVWFIAVQWMDIVWSILVLVGIEKLRIVPGFTQASPFDLYYMPFTHSLPGSIAISLLLGAIVALFAPEKRIVTMLLIAGASFSHWILDFVVHIPDLPLYDNTAKVGLGLWRHVALSFPLELALLVLGAWFYARQSRFGNASGKHLYWGFVVLLAALQAYGNFGPAPASPRSMAITAFSFYVVVALVAGLVERMALASTQVTAAS
jgi:hypothetical protein